MDIKINCPNCGQHILVDSTTIGQQATCPTCSKPLTIASAPPAVSSSPPLSPIPQKGAATHKGRLVLWLAVAGVVCVIATALGIWSYSGSKNRLASSSVSVSRKVDAPVASNVSASLVVSHTAPAVEKMDTSSAEATSETWRTSLTAYGKELAAVAEKSKILDASFAITRMRDYTVFTGAKGREDKLWVVFKDGFDNELHGEYARHFTGPVSWRGVVDSVKTDKDQKAQIIDIIIPVPKNLPKGMEIQTITLSIPIAKLPTTKLPAKGSEFAFRGNLKKEKDDAFFEPVSVMYGLGPNAGKLHVGTDLVDVEPLDSPSTTPIQPAPKMQSDEAQAGTRDANASSEHALSTPTAMKVVVPERAQKQLHVFSVDGKYGYIDAHGEIAIAPRFTRAWEFSEGLAGVEIGKQAGYIDTKGELVFQTPGTPSFPFSEGLAQFNIMTNGSVGFGYIDKSGKKVISLKYDQAGPFHEGLARVDLVTGPVRQYGFIDKTGRLVIDAKYTSAFSFSEGFASVYVGGKSEWGILSGGKAGYIDKSGKLVIAPQFELTLPFSEGLAQVTIEGKAGFIDRSGRVVIPAMYEVFGSAFAEAPKAFHEGLAAVMIDKKVGYIDTNGNWVVKPQFTFGGPFSCGLAAVYMGGKIERELIIESPTGGKYAYIDRQGSIVIPPTYDKASAFDGGLASVSVAHETFYINTSGQKMWPKKEQASKKVTEISGENATETVTSRVTTPNTSASTSKNWPKYSGELNGGMEVRVKNPNEFGVTVGLRSAGKGKDFNVGANDAQSVQVPNGRYDIYFQYSTDPDGLYQGDSFTLNDDGVEIQIVKVVNGNYGIRKVK